MVTCVRNGIKIYYQAIDNYNGKIAINDNGKIKLGLETYKNCGSKFQKGDKFWWKIIEALYTQEYFKLPEGLKELKIKEVELEFYVKFNK